jgi:hypothetical protein
MSKTKLGDYGLSWQTKVLAPDTNVEVSNTIIERVEGWGLYSIDALTQSGWLRMLGVECGEYQRMEIVRRLYELQEGWKEPRTTMLIKFPSREIPKLPSADSVPTESVDLSTEPSDATVNEWVFSSEEILQRLESNMTTSEDRVTAVLFAETTAFSKSQQPRLLRALFEFCDQNRFSRNDELTTAVGSAIRKFAMNMPSSEFELYSRLFLPTATSTLSCEIELELAKAVSWRLAKVKNTKTGEYPILEARLSELASDYLTTRLILQENYASIVIHAVIAVGLLHGARQDEFIDRIANLRMEWFCDLFARRLLDVAHKRQGAASEDAANLTRLHQRLTAAGR